MKPTSDSVASPCLCDTLRQSTRAVTRMYDDALRPVNLRITQYSVLSFLAFKGESRVRDLGAGLLIEETTLTRSLRPLEEQGWVESRAGEDRRARYVSITREGRQLLTRARPLWQRAQDRMREGVSANTWDELFRLLPKVARGALGEDFVPQQRK